MKKPLLFSCLSVLLAFSLSAEPITFMEPAFSLDLKDYSTFNFKQLGTPVSTEAVDPTKKEIMRGYAKEAVEREMKARGVKLGENPELYIHMYLNLRNENFERENKVAASRPSYYNSPFYDGYDIGNISTEVMPKVVGKMIIDFVDVKKKLVWQGISSGWLDPDSPDLQKLINQAVVDVFKQLEAQNKKN